MLAAVGIGAYSTIQEAAEAMVRTTTLYTPRKMQAYETMFTLYRNLYENLKPRFEELAQLRSNQ
jgi:sugar (pentulose or hexulose) kinase